ncbi:MAG: PaaI family thioesterase [Anaerolineae bacterium]
MRKQPNSRMCFVCGMENPIGLKLFFYENEQGQVIAHFTPREEHQGYPEVMHGGLVTALLDEIMGRVAIGRELWMVTAKMEVKFRHPVPIGQPLTLVGEATRLRGRIMQARGEIRLEDGTVAAEAQGICVRLPDEEIQRLQGQIGFWEIVPD